MNIGQLLEERAERGSARGSANVWLDAQPQLPTKQRVDVSRFALRAALALSVVVFAAAAAGRAGVGIGEVSRPASETPEAADPNLPAPIWLEDHTLDHVMEPFDIGQFDSVGSRIIRTRVYVDPASDSAPRVVGIDTLQGGGFQPWGANLSSDAVEELIGEVVRDGDGWGLPAEVTWPEVARFSDDLEDTIRTGWQLDFRRASERPTLQAQPDSGGAEWLWVARAARNADEPLTARVVTVADRTGLVLQSTNGADEQPSGNEVVWSSDGFVYRLTNNELVGDTHVQRAAEPLIDQLVVIDRSEWQEAIGDASQPSLATQIEQLLSLIVVLAWLVSAIWFLARGHRSLALVGVLAVVGLLFFIPDFLVVIAASVLLVAAWLAARTAAEGVEEADPEISAAQRA